MYAAGGLEIFFVKPSRLGLDRRTTLGPCGMPNFAVFFLFNPN
jgi:hypothetical protein